MACVRNFLLHLQTPEVEAAVRSYEHSTHLI